MNNKESLMISKWRFCTLALVLLFSTGLSAQGKNSIKLIQSSVQSGADVLRVELDEALIAIPTGFVIQTPPRIAIDLPNIGNSVGKSNVEINQGNLRSVNIAQSGERTRLVLNLKKPSGFRIAIQGKTLLIALEGDVQIDAVATEVTPAIELPRFSESLNNQSLALKDIDFRRGAEGAGRVIVNLANNQVGVDIHQQGDNLIVEFVRSTLPADMRKRLDVSDFGTPVQNIVTTQIGDRVRLVIESRGNWEHSAYQSDTQFVLEVRPKKIDLNKLTQGIGYSGEKLSLNFQNIEVRALLQVIADFTNFNVVTSDTVTGNVTLRLKDIPWDQALDIIMQSKGLGQRKSGNVILIAPKDELNAKEKVELEAKAQLAALEPLRTQSFQLNYAKAADVATGLTGQGSGQSGSTASRILSARGSVIYEIRTNQLFVSDVPSKLEEIQVMIAKIDIPVRQVLIEARIVIADDSFGRSLGVKLGASDLRGVRGGVPGYGIGGSNRVTIGGNLNAVGSQTLQNGSTSVAFSDTNFVNLPASSENGFNPASFALSLFSASANRFLNLEISALEADGNGKVVSSPRVITADQQKALIEQGEEIPYNVATSSGATSIQFRKANLKLEVTPQITPEGGVILDVDVTKDSRGATTPAGFAINTKHVQTKILVENGGTVVIGGIFEQSDREDVTKVPFLGDVPYFGNLFKSRTKSSNKTELLIFLTPKVISDRASARE